jgi:hypothetical protein
MTGDYGEEREDEERELPEPKQPIDQDAFDNYGADESSQSTFQDEAQRYQDGGGLPAGMGNTEQMHADDYGADTADDPAKTESRRAGRGIMDDANTTDSLSGQTRREYYEEMSDLQEGASGSPDDQSAKIEGAKKTSEFSGVEAPKDSQIDVVDDLREQGYDGRTTMKTDREAGKIGEPEIEMDSNSEPTTGPHEGLHYAQMKHAVEEGRASGKTEEEIINGLNEPGNIAEAEKEAYGLEENIKNWDDPDKGLTSYETPYGEYTSTISHGYEGAGRSLGSEDETPPDSPEETDTDAKVKESIDQREGQGTYEQVEQETPPPEVEQLEQQQEELRQSLEEKLPGVELDDENSVKEELDEMREAGAGEEADQLEEQYEQYQQQQAELEAAQEAQQEEYERLKEEIAAERRRIEEEDRRRGG